MFKAGAWPGARGSKFEGSHLWKGWFKTRVQQERGAVSLPKDAVLLLIPVWSGVSQEWDSAAQGNVHTDQQIQIYQTWLFQCLEWRGARGVPRLRVVLTCQKTHQLFSSQPLPADFQGKTLNFFMQRVILKYICKSNKLFFYYYFLTEWILIVFPVWGFGDLHFVFHLHLGISKHRLEVLIHVLFFVLHWLLPVLGQSFSAWYDKRFEAFHSSIFKDN